MNGNYVQPHKKRLSEPTKKNDDNYPTLYRLIFDNKERRVSILLEQL